MSRQLHPHKHFKRHFNTLYAAPEHTTLSACILPLPVKSIFPFLLSRSTMKCYRWKTRACSTGPDICEYSERTKFDRHIITTDQSAILQSPRYEDLVNETVQTFGHHFFCVYNVSLNCPGSVAVIRPTSTTNWPKGDCQNYVSFSAHRNSSKVTQQFCGQRNYRAVMGSDFFLGVMWTNKYQNDGVFEFCATCSEQKSFLAPTSTADEEGSGMSEYFLDAQGN